MKGVGFLIAGLLIAALAVVALAYGGPQMDAQAEAAKLAAAKSRYFVPEESKSAGSINAAGHHVSYQAVAGTLIVHPAGWDDVKPPESAAEPGDKETAAPPGTASSEEEDKNPSAEASMFYVAYMKSGARPETRPVTFLFNGGPGSSTVWLHMGAFGPKRVVTAEDSHSPAAPYTIVDNKWSLLDASDLVFVDAPGTGFSRIAGKDKEKTFYGVDGDAHAFAEFISAFLSKYGRWNSPKYLFGESYGTTRSAVLVNMLETQRAVDFNGVILLSQILNFDLSPDAPEMNPAVDLPYQLALPTYAATAWYHHKLPIVRKELRPFLTEVEHFTMNEYALALQAGATLSDDKRKAIAQKLHEYSGLPIDYILKADLRINGGEFSKNLQDDNDVTTGRLDTRFSGPTLDPLSKQADYDPQSAAISSAYVSAFNDYARKTLNYGEGKSFKPILGIWQSWDFSHEVPGAEYPQTMAPNVMTDLSMAMKVNPNLRVQLHAGFFDLATPYFEGVYEMQHLAIPTKMQANIEYAFYESGHMVYAREDDLRALHDNTAAFIRKTSNVKAR